MSQKIKVIQIWKFKEDDNNCILISTAGAGLRILEALLLSLSSRGVILEFEVVRDPPWRPQLQDYGVGETLVMTTHQCEMTGAGCASRASVWLSKAESAVLEGMSKKHLWATQNKWHTLTTALWHSQKCTSLMTSSWNSELGLCSTFLNASHVPRCFYNPKRSHRYAKIDWCWISQPPLWAKAESQVLVICSSVYGNSFSKSAT
jgi:hypothetical protein